VQVAPVSIVVTSITANEISSTAAVEVHHQQVDVVDRQQASTQYLDTSDFRNRFLVFILVNKCKIQNTT
jgi:hypothetical protein